MLTTATAPTRDYSLYFEHRPDYLYVRVDPGEVSYETTRRYWNEIVGMRHRRHYSRILVDNDIANELPTDELFVFVSDLAWSGLSDVAVAINPRKYNADACELQEMIGTNRGLNMKVCDSLDRAKRYVSAM